MTIRGILYFGLRFFFYSSAPNGPYNNFVIIIQYVNLIDLNNIKTEKAVGDKGKKDKGKKEAKKVKKNQQKVVDQAQRALKRIERTGLVTKTKRGNILL